MGKRDFFISYTTKDEAWAVWIADTLKANGYTAYCQALDIKPGDDFVEKMEEFFENSANFLAAWSKGYSESPYCMKEFRAAYNGLKQGWMGCLLPVRIDSHPLKRLYSSLVHVDLSDRGAASAQALMDAVRGKVPRSVAPSDSARTELRDVRCLTAADTMDAHLAELEEDRFCKPAGKAALLARGHELTELIRQGTPEAARQCLLGKLEPTLDAVIKENGYLLVLKPLAEDVYFLKEWLCGQNRDAESMAN